VFGGGSRTRISEAEHVISVPEIEVDTIAEIKYDSGVARYMKIQNLGSA
jgi:hypothetical protein